MKTCDNGHEQIRVIMLTIIDISQKHIMPLYSHLCSHHHEQVARALLENGAAVNSQNKKGYTALMYSAQDGHEEVCS